MEAKLPKIALLAIIIVLGVFFLASVFITNKNVTVTSLPLNLPPPTPAANTVTNTDYGFKLEYPQAWHKEEWDLKDAAKLDSAPDGSIIYQLTLSQEDKKFELLIWENKSNLDAPVWVKEFLHEEIDRKLVPSESNYTVDGTEAIILDSESKARNTLLTYIFFNHRNKIFELVSDNGEEIINNLKLNSPL